MRRFGAVVATLVSIAASCVILLTSDHISSFVLLKQLFLPASFFFCGKGPAYGKNEFFYTEIIESTKTNYLTFLYAGLALIVFSVVVRRLSKKETSVILEIFVSIVRTMSMYFMIVSLLGYLHQNSESESICNTIVKRLEDSLVRPAHEMILPFFTWSIVTDIPPPSSENAAEIYDILFAYFSEFAATVTPYLYRFYLVLGIVHAIKPLREIYNNHSLLCGLLLTIPIIVGSSVVRPPNMDSSHYIATMVLQYVVCWLLTTVSLPLVIFVLRANFRKNALVGAILILMRAHEKGWMPEMPLHVEVFVAIFIAVTVSSYCSYNSGWFVLWALAAYENKWVTIEWTTVLVLAGSALEYFIFGPKKANQNISSETKAKTE
eukprot:TRINITY_DN2378_c0_g1_i1.p1 TRINITY_DN2378_c0_g1~~TRINITY_DN2378_c0_g1_i1.p1  ORF type:complete len:377 (-),score=81.50 TRINITY_DN2378_c0_g1_i1:21-1151(-)